MKHLLLKLKVWLLKDAGSQAQRYGTMKTKDDTEWSPYEQMENWEKVLLVFIICVVALLGCVFILGASAPKPKLSVADKMAMAKSYSVPCLDCNSSGVLKYRLKPVKPPTITGGRAVPNGVMQEIILHFRCPFRHEFSAPGPDRFIPAIRAEEEK